MRPSIRWAILATARLSTIALLAGCASITHGPNEQLAVNSEPSGADVWIDCGGRRIDSGVTPARLVIPRRAENCKAHVSREGFEEQTVSMERGFSRHYWSNLAMATALPVSVVVAFASDNENAAGALLGVALAGSFGLVFDRVTGAMYDHDPNRLSVRLREKTR